MPSASSIWSPEITLRRLCLSPPTEDEEDWSAENRRIIDLLDGTALNHAASLNNVYNIVEIRVQEEAQYRQAADANLQGQISGLVEIPIAERPIVQWHGQVIENSLTIPDNVNAFTFGPSIEIADGQSVTVGDNSHWTIAEGVAGNA